MLHVVVRRHHRCRRRRRDDECDEPESRLGLIITNQRRHQTSPKTDSLTVFLRLHSRRGRGVRIAMGWCSENHRHVRRRATIGDRGTRAVVASVNRSRFASDIFPHSPLTRARRPPHRLHSMPSSHLRYTPRHTSSTPCGRSRNVLEPPKRSRATSRARNANSSPVASSPPTPSTPHHRHIARESPSSSSSSSSSSSTTTHPSSSSTRRVRVVRLVVIHVVPARVHRRIAVESSRRGPVLPGVSRRRRGGWAARPVWTWVFTLVRPRVFEF